MSEQQKTELFQRIEEALDSIRPHLAADGGNVELVDVTDDMTVKVKWLGNCESCFMSMMTMKAGVERAIKTNIPSIRKVDAINGLDA